MNWINPFNTAYNVPNTLLLSFTGVLISWLIWRLLKKEKIKIDKKVVFSTVFWIVLTAEIRVLEDLKVIHSPLFTSPWIYYMTILITLFSTFTSYKISKKKYWYSGFLPLFVSIFLFSQFHFRNYLFITYFFPIYLPWFFLSFAMYRDFGFSKESFLALAAQTFDASVTSVSIKYFHYVSKHVLPTAVIKLGGPFSFLLVKFFTVFAILLFIDKKVADKQLRNYIKLLIAYFALLTGTRDLIRALCLI